MPKLLKTISLKFVLLISIVIVIVVTYLYHNVESIQLPYDKIIQTNMMINSCICNDSDIKIFNLGLPKCGTQSLNDLLNTIGCKSIHLVANKTLIKLDKLTKDGYKGKLHKKSISIGSLMKFALENNNSAMYYFKDNINCFTQMDAGQLSFFPQITHYKLLNEQYPKSLFILMIRNITNHIRSIDNWKTSKGNLRQRYIDGNFPYLPSGKGKTDQEMRWWIQRHYGNVTQYFKRFPNRFLLYNIEKDKVDKIKKFIGCDGDYQFPHKHWNVNIPKISQSAIS